MEIAESTQYYALQLSLSFESILFWGGPGISREFVNSYYGYVVFTSSPTYCDDIQEINRRNALP